MVPQTFAFLPGIHWIKPKPTHPPHLSCPLHPTALVQSSSLPAGTVARARTLVSLVQSCPWPSTLHTAVRLVLPEGNLYHVIFVLLLCYLGDKTKTF